MLETREIIPTSLGRISPLIISEAKLLEKEFPLVSLTQTLSYLPTFAGAIWGDPPTKGPNSTRLVELSAKRKCPLCAINYLDRIPQAKGLDEGSNAIMEL